MKYYWIVTFSVFLFAVLGMVLIAARLENIFLITALDVLWGAACVYAGQWFLKE